VTTVILLHGWTATADLNWFRCYRPLAERYRVIAFDHRGHGTGIRSKKPFRLEDCADDVVDVARALGVRRFVPVGYSMGGPIAQLIWRRRPRAVEGLVLCATAASFVERRPERLSLLGITGLAALARRAPDQAQTWLSEQVYLQRKSAKWDPWAVREAAAHDWTAVLDAGKAIGSFSSVGWIGSIDVPVSLIATTRDQVIPLARQARLFELIPDAEVFRVNGLHDSAVVEADTFVPALVRAVESIRARR
jgi:3-oxoadipate enol-lactonase